MASSNSHPPPLVIAISIFSVIPAGPNRHFALYVLEIAVADLPYIRSKIPAAPIPPPAHGHHSVPHASSLHFIQQRGRQLRPTTSERMARRDGPSVHIQAIWIDRKLAQTGEHLCPPNASFRVPRDRCRRVTTRPASALSNSWHRTDPNSSGRTPAVAKVTKRARGLRPRSWAWPTTLRVPPRHRRGLRRVPGSHRAGSVESRAKLGECLGDVSRRGPSSLSKVTSRVSCVPGPLGCTDVET